MDTEIAPRKDWRYQILPDYDKISGELTAKYVSNPRANGPGEESQGPERFLITLDLALERVKERPKAKAMAAAESIYKALNIIAERPRAGRTAWQMRRLIRRAPPYMIKQFGNLARRWAEVSPDRVWLDMDSYYCDIEGGARPRARTLQEFERIKWNINNETGKK